MLSFFRLFDPSKAIFLLLLALILRLPFALLDLPFPDEQVLWLALGEKFLSGFRLYSEIWTTHPPIFAWISSVLFLMFSNAVFGQVLASTLIVWLSALLLNFLFSEIEAFNSKTYVPGAMFILLSCASFEFLSPSPQLLATPFLILSLRFILKIFRKEVEYDSIFFSAILFAVASAVSFPTIFLLPFFVLFLLFGTSGKLYHIIWWFSSFLFFWLILTFNFWIKSESEFFIRSVFFQAFTVLDGSFWEYRIYFAIFSPVLFLLIIAVFNLVFRSRLLNYHVRIQRTFLTLGILSIISVVFSGRLAFYGFYLLIIPITFFLSQYYLGLKRTGLNEFIFTGPFLLSIFLNVSLVSESFIFKNIPKEKRSYSGRDISVSGKSVCVFGEPSGYLRGNRLAGPILDWDLSEKKLESMAPLEFVSIIHSFFENDPPDYVIDKNGYFRRLLRSDPLLKKKYTRLNGPVYFRDG
jgi:hypothetical protein